MLLVLPPLCGRRTWAVFQVEGITPVVMERLKIWVICSKITVAEVFRKKGSSLSSPVDFFGSILIRALQTWTEYNIVRLRLLSESGTEIAGGVPGSAWRSVVWTVLSKRCPAAAKCLLKAEQMSECSVKTVESAKMLAGSVRILLCFPFMFLDSWHVLFPVCLCCHVLVVIVLSGHVFPVFVLRLRPHLPLPLPGFDPHLFPICTLFVSLIGTSCVLLIPLV